MSLGLAYVIATGPSCPVADLHLLDQEFTVGVNFLASEAEWDPKVIWWHDTMAEMRDKPRAGKFYPYCQTTKAIKVTSERPQNLEANPHYCLPHTHPPEDWGETPKAVSYLDCRLMQLRGASGVAAIRWCYALGFDKVIGLGFGGAGHFYDPGVKAAEATFDRENARAEDMGAILNPPVEDWMLEGTWSRLSAQMLLEAKLGADLRPTINRWGVAS